MASTKREKELARQRAARQAARRAERDRRKKRRTAVTATVVVVLLIAAAGAAAVIGTRGDTPGNDTLATEPGTSPTEEPGTGPDDDPTDAPTDEPDAGEAPAEAVTVGDCAYRPDGEPVRDVEPPSEQDLVLEGTRTATLTTDQGALGLELLAADAPCTVASFASLSRQGYYADTPCHRLVTEGIFVLQCGDPTGTGRGGPGYSFDEENLEGATYPRGTVAMAKTAAPGTSGSQFFLVFQDTPLPPEYTPFARITEGLEVLDAIAAAGAAEPDQQGTTAPNQPVQITAVEVA